MKLQRLLFLFILGGLISLNSCKKDEEPQSTSKTNEMRTKIDGTLWANPIQSWANVNGTVQVNANSPDGSYMQVFIPEDTVGTFTAADNVVTVAYYDGTAMYSNNISGFVTVTTNTSTHVEGEFEMVISSFFGANDTLDFTEGTFHWKF